jgi:predicted permease
VGINPPVLLFTLGLSVATGIGFGILPALRASRPDLDALLRDARATDSRSRKKLRSALVVAEIALSLMLLIGAGLLLRSFAKAAGVDLGIQPRGAVTFQISLPDRRYPDGASILRFEEELRRRPPPGKRFSSYQYNASPGFLAGMGGRLLRGRDLRETDDAQHPVALVDDGFVRRFFPNEDPLGHYIAFEYESVGTNLRAEIVGVYAHMHQYAAGETDPIDAGMILPISWGASLAPQWFRGLSAVVRTDGEMEPLLAAARREIQSIDPELPVAGVKTLEGALDEAMAHRRFSLVVLGLFAAVALLLAAVGVYGVMSYGVVQRTREIGVRMALGARQEDVLRLVVGDGARLALAGTAIGLFLAALLSRLLRGMLFGVSAFDPLSYAALTALLAAVALLASWLPARRAARVDPHEALRAE